MCSSDLGEGQGMWTLAELKKFYRGCVRSAMLYGSETWCLRENEMAILRRNERAMVRAIMCGAKEDRAPNGDVMIEN